MKRLVVFMLLILFLILSLQPAHSITLKELLTRYKFSAATEQMNVMNYTDFMIDKDGNGINDTLIFELTTNNSEGNFIFAISLHERNGIISNEINELNKTLNSGVRKVNVSYESAFLPQSQFNYSIKIYNSSHSLKYRKDSIPSREYSNYEEGFKILEIKEFKDDKKLVFNVTLKSSINGTFETKLFLPYNSSAIFVKGNKLISNSVQRLMFAFDNETIKKSHYAGRFSNISLKIGGRLLKTNFTTAVYDFRDFAAGSYISNFSDAGIIGNSRNNKYNSLQINVSAHIEKNGNYSLSIGLYDLSGSLLDTKNLSYFLNTGNHILPLNFNSTVIYQKRLEGPFIVKHISLFENGILADSVRDAYITKRYNFDDFDNDNLELPDLVAKIAVSGSYHYGISNITANFTFENIGNRHAFNIFAEMFSNGTFSTANKSNFLVAGSKVYYQVNFTNISDFEINAIADLNDFIEELNETNNAERLIIKLNKRPSLMQIGNVTANETDRIIINLSAADANNDNLSFYINTTRFLNKNSGNPSSSDSAAFVWYTSTTEAGNYTLMATASDGYLNDSKIFYAAIKDTPEKDTDNDGINNSIDSLIGNEKSVNTSTISLTVIVDGSSNLSRLFNGSMEIKFVDSNLTIAEFYFNFSLSRLNLSNLTIDKQPENATGSLLLKGLKMAEGSSKVLYLDRINMSLNGICIKDEEISSIMEISSSCGAGSEYQVECDGTLQNYYRCSYNSTLGKFKVEGLKHSGIVQIDYSKPASESGSSTASASASGSSGGSGGGSRSSESPACISCMVNAKNNDNNVGKEKNGKIKSSNAINVIVPIRFEDRRADNKIRNMEGVKNINKITGNAVGANQLVGTFVFTDAVNIIAISLIVVGICFAGVELYRK